MDEGRDEERQGTHLGVFYPMLCTKRPVQLILDQNYKG